MLNRILQLLLVLSAIIALLLGTIPKVIGISIRDADVTNLFDLIPTETRGQLSINETQFDNGWFRSTAQINVSYTALDLVDELTVLLEFDISHGPFIFTKTGPKFGLAHAKVRPSFSTVEITSVLTQIPFELPRLSFDLFVAFDQSLTATIEVSPINYNGSAARVNFAGMDGSLKAKPDQSSEILVSVRSLQLKDLNSQFGFDLESLNLQSSSTQISDIFAPRSARLKIPAISISGPLEVSAQDILINSQIRKSAVADALDIYQELRVASIKSVFPVISFSWTTEIKQFKTEIIRSYYELITNLQAQTNPNSSTAINQSGFINQQLGMRIVQNGLILNNLILANAFDGDHSVDLKINWAGLPNLKSAAELNMSNIINTITMVLEISLDKQAIMSSQFSELVEAFAQQNFLRMENDRILLSGSLENGELNVNGEDIPIDQFF
ncbi:MAG: DUF945 family protein [Gammaproteobacteria bacterium]|jgi:uncharacterized protein YdgA (DUF945 family)|nr:DUF945 family protein [Gammaproteobacteria bacterium]